MSKSKLSNSKAFKRFLVIILAITVVAIAFFCIRSRLAVDESTIQSEYKIYTGKYELLRTIADEAIHEGEYININAFNREEIMYKVYNNDDQTILVHYWLDEKVENTFPFFAKILLSSDYQILDEDFSTAEEYDFFKWQYQFKESLLFLWYSLIVLVAFYVLVCFCYGFITLTGVISKLFKYEKRSVRKSEPDNSNEDTEQDNS